MALFSSSRDASLVRSLNRELMRRIITIEVEFYKLALNETESNIYGESNKKTYYQPVRLYSLINKSDTTSADDDTGLNISKSVVYSFLRDDLVDLGLVIEIGDIIKYDAAYYEIDNVRHQQYWMGRNPDTLIAQVQREINEHGYSVAISAEAHMTRLSSLNLVEVRSGINTIKTHNQKIIRNL